MNQNDLESTKLKTTYVALSTPHLYSPLRKHLTSRSQAFGMEARADNEPSYLPKKESKACEFGVEKSVGVELGGVESG